MKREELKICLAIDATAFYDNNEEMYCKSEADSVMDEMEMTLACYEDEVHQLRKQLEDVQNTMATENVDLGMENFKLKERIKELEDKVQMHDFFWEGCGLSKRGFKNTINVANYIEELEASQPKWISVEDRLPTECEDVVCIDKWEAKSVCWLEYMYESTQWTDGDRDYPMDFYTHWMPLPPPPKSED